jgi:hypothetical protein
MIEVLRLWSVAIKRKRTELNFYFQNFKKWGWRVLKEAQSVSFEIFTL